MRIGLIDVDSHNFPNLALMKLSAYHKAIGDRVEWWNGFLRYDKVYQSKIFDDTYSPDMEFCINREDDAVRLSKDSVQGESDERKVQSRFTGWAGHKSRP